MMNGEYPAHKKALKEGGWLQGGEILNYWFREDDSPVSFYVVAFMSFDKIYTIDFLRVFGGTDGYPAQISVDKRVRMEEWKQMFGENK